MSKHAFVSILCICVIFLIGWLYVKSLSSLRRNCVMPEHRELYQQITRECPSCHGDPIWFGGVRHQTIQCHHCGTQFKVRPYGYAERMS